MNIKKRRIWGAVIGGIVAPILVLVWAEVRYHQIMAQLGPNTHGVALVEVGILQVLVAPLSIPFGAIFGFLGAVLIDFTIPREQP